MNTFLILLTTADAPKSIKANIDKGIEDFNKNVPEEHSIGAGYGWSMKIPD